MFPLRAVLYYKDFERNKKRLIFLISINRQGSKQRPFNLK